MPAAWPTARFGTLAPVYGYARSSILRPSPICSAVTAIVGAIAQTPFGRLSDRIDRRLVIVELSGFAAVIGLFTILLNPSNGPLMFVLFGLYGLGAYPLYAIAVAHANDFAKGASSGASPAACC